MTKVTRTVIVPGGETSMKASTSELAALRNQAGVTDLTAWRQNRDRAARRRLAVDRTVAKAEWAEYVAYVKAHPGMLDELAGRDLELATRIVAESRSIDAT